MPCSFVTVILSFQAKATFPSNVKTGIRQHLEETLFELRNDLTILCLW